MNLAMECYSGTSFKNDEEVAKWLPLRGSELKQYAIRVFQIPFAFTVARR